MWAVGVKRNPQIAVIDVGSGRESNMCAAISAPNLHIPTETTPKFLNSTTTVRLLLNKCNTTHPFYAHANILKSGLQTNIYVSNALLSSYFNHGLSGEAQKVFEQMLHRDVVSWTALLSGHCRNGAPDLALCVFRNMMNMLEDEETPKPNDFTVAAVLKACGLQKDEETGRMMHCYCVVNGFLFDRFVNDSLVDMYAKCGSLSSSEKVAVKSGLSNVVSWTSLISGCVENGLNDMALDVFLEMIVEEDGCLPNEVTLLSVIRALSSSGDHRRLLSPVHGYIVKSRMGDDVLIANSLLEMYARNGFVSDCLKIFIHCHLLNWKGVADQELMAVVLHACSISSSLGVGEEIHGYLIKNYLLPSTLLENSLMDMYGKKGESLLAHRLFLTMGDQDIVSWNTMISCFVKNDRIEEALQLLTQLHSSAYHLKSDFITLLNSIQACSQIASLQQGEILHAYSLKAGIDHDVFVSNSLIDMYANSGSIKSASRIFTDMSVKDLGSWNSIIAAYGMHGDGISALHIFEELKTSSSENPNAITFLNVISACSHSGLISESTECFRSMTRDYRLEPTIEHYSSMVDLLCRHGKLREAVNFIEHMPIQPGSSIWRSLLGASAVTGNTRIAEMAAEKLAFLNPFCDAWKVSLSNAYSIAGRWELAAMVRAQMRVSNSRKEAGWSCVELRGGERFRFMVADTSHPQSKEIYQLLDGIMGQVC